MDRPLAKSGSVKRARERAQAGLPRSPPRYHQTMDEEPPPGDLRAPPRRQLAAPPILPGQSKLPRSRAPADGKNATAGQTISRPTQVPQWPLPGPPIAPTNSSESEPYRPPPGKPQQAPQRPPRPSQVPSLLDQSRLQDPTPVFLNPQSIPENDSSSQDYTSSVPQTPSSRMTSSSMGSIPDFPVPVATPTNGHPRRSANLGPPPSSRRGASSFYSNASYVSPIPEESLATRSHGSYASSAAMPDNWPGGSPEGSPTFYEDTDTEKSRDSVYDEFTDESKLVRSASIGKRGKPTVITTKSPGSTDHSQRPAPSPVQPFDGGTSYIDVSTSSSNTLPMSKPTFADTSKGGLTPDAVLGAYAAASSTDAADQQFSKLSAIRRPPKLDIDAVRDMEARGSITSLPDLIRRATRLASMIDRGRRPASRFENFSDYLDEKSDARGGSKDISVDRHQSGLSDMLAAFPPPGQPADRQSRGSWFRTTSWPLAPSRQDGTHSRSTRRGMTPSEERPKQGRRCCGLPIWAFILVVLLIICMIVAAIVVPLEFFVFKNLGNHDKPQSEMDKCQISLVCKNGGTNVISQGVCSCICTNGFTGSDCSASGSDGCTTTNLSSPDDDTVNVSNVTLGKAIPRLLEGGAANFSIPLSGTAVMAKFNAGDLSCIAQNSLVTFDGQLSRVGEGTAKAKAATETLEVAAVERTATESISVITVSPDVVATTLVLDDGTPTPVATTDGADNTDEPTATQTMEPGGATTTAAPTSKPSGSGFIVTEETLDFARVVILYILQEESAASAETAQTKLHRFFTNALSNEGVEKSSATNISIGGDNKINLNAFTVNIGAGAIGGKTKRDILPDTILQSLRLEVPQAARHGGSVLSNR
ncbi:Fc.00g036950.m01.CDS01 [Cosmosporella sp. VM-42]